MEQSKTPKLMPELELVETGVINAQIHAFSDQVIFSDQHGQKVVPAPTVQRMLPPASFIQKLGPKKFIGKIPNGGTRDGRVFECEGVTATAVYEQMRTAVHG